MRSLFATLLLALAVLAAWLAWRGSASPREPAGGPATGEHAPAAPAVPVAPAVSGGEPGPGAHAAPPAPAAARSAPESAFVWSDAARALFERARKDPELCTVVAEVVALGPVARRETDDMQDVTLRALADSSDGSLRRWRRVNAPLLPAASEAQFGCRTPFGELAVGQVRECVLGRELPDFGMRLELHGAMLFRSHWLVLAGPEVERPDDPVLARVPAELHVWLGRPACSVFRARVHEVHLGASGDAGAAGGAKALAQQFDRLAVDVLEVAQASERLPLPKRVLFAPQPFAAKLALEALEAGREYWFVSDDSSLLLVLCAFAPLR